MIKQFEKCIWAWRETKEIKEKAYNVMLQNQEYIRRGTWRLAWCGKPVLLRISKKSKMFYQKIKSEYDRNIKLKMLFKEYMQNVFSFGWRFHCNNDSGNDWKADCVMLSRTGSVYLYDLDKQTVKKHYTNDISIKGYNALAEACYWNVFKSPIVSCHENISYEKIITEGHKIDSNHNKYQCVLKKYKEYFKISKPVSLYFISDLVIQWQKEIPKFNRIFSKSVLDLPLNGYMLHGDFNVSNIIFDKNGSPYVIDYEHVSIYPFCFDILYWIWVDILWRNEWKLWKQIIDPTSDIGKMFHEILELQHIPDNSNNKVALMTLTAFIKFQRDIQNKNNTEWSERDLTDYYISRFKDNVVKLTDYLSE